MARKKAAKKAGAKAPVKRAGKTPPFGPYPEWTEARFFGFLRSALRSASARYPPKYEALNRATRPYVGPDKRRKKERLCAKCQNWFPTTQTQADHIVPAGRMSNWEEVVPFMQNLFCGVDGYQCLCEQCHLEKTKEERNASKEAKGNIE